MNLPAKATSWVGASALCGSPPNSSAGFAPLNRDAGYVMAKHWLRNTALLHPLNLSQLVDLTIHGERAAHDVLVELGAAKSAICAASRLCADEMK
jgi:hypothetical protein